LPGHPVKVKTVPVPLCGARGVVGFSLGRISADSAASALPYSGNGYPFVRPPLAVGPLTEAVTEFQWLPPTPANLAQLDAPIPPGFRVSG
jgi:hypothetical protein